MARGDARRKYFQRHNEAVPVRELDDNALRDLIDRMREWIGPDATRTAGRYIVSYVGRERGRHETTASSDMGRGHVREMAGQ